MDKRVIDLHFPMGGMDRGQSFQRQPPYTSIDVLNTRPDNSSTQRESGGSRPGLGKAFALRLGDADGEPVRMLNTVTFLSSNVLLSRAVAISKGTLYREHPAGTLESVAGGSFSETKLLHSAERGQKLYIADHDDDPTISAAARVPKVYDPVANTISNLTASTGTLPLGANCICTWRDRLVLAGGTTNPYGLFMSRQGDPTDWDYSETDTGAAVSLALADAGQMGDVITAISPHTDNCLIVGSPSQIWIIRGDPNFGGQIDILSQKVGVVDRGAWTTTPDGMFVFLSHDGVYALPASCAAARYPESISHERLPTELKGVDRTTHTVLMSYDVADRGIHIFVTPNTVTSETAPATHWWMDWKGKGFWKVKLAKNEFEPTSLHERRNYASTASGVLVGGRDGYVRRFINSNSEDDSEPYSSHVIFGPFGDPHSYSDSSIDELIATLSEDSSNVDWRVFSGDTAWTAAPDFLGYTGFSASGEWGGGRNNSQYPRVRGAAMYLQVGNFPTGEESGSFWGWENGTMILSRRGKTRV